MEWIFGSIPLAGMVLLIIHIIKTGRDRSWIYIVLFIPVAGALAYLLIEVIPSLFQTRQGRAVKKTVVSAVLSGSRIKRLRNELELSNTFEKKCALADAFRENHRHDLAVPLYRESLSGIFADNVDVKHNLADCLFNLGQFQEAEEILASLDQAPGRLKKAAIFLLRARTLEALGKISEAEELYSRVAPEFPGFEGYARYALFLKNTGKHDEALKQLKIISGLSATLPPHNRRIEREWISLAKQELKAAR